MGGINNDTNNSADSIYYAVSTDINKNSDIKNNNIWQKSEISLPYPLRECKCMITHQSTKYPKIIILGGYNETNIFLEFQLSHVIGKDRFIYFMLDFKQVITHIFFLCVCVLFMFCGLFVTHFENAKQNKIVSKYFSNI